MAGPTNTESEFTYVNYYRGKFVIRTTEDDPNDKKRTRKTSDGRDIWEIPYGKLEDMMLADIRLGHHEDYGDSFEWIMSANNEYYLLRFGQNSGTTSMVMNRLENIDITKPFTLNAWQPKDDEKKTVITIWQDGQLVEKARERDKNLPPAKQVMVNGKMQWDFTDQIELYKQIVEGIRPHLPGVHQQMAAVAREQAQPAPATAKTSGPKDDFVEAPHGPATDGKPDDTDDLPF